MMINLFDEDHIDDDDSTMVVTMNFLGRNVDDAVDNDRLAGRLAVRPGVSLTR